MAHLAQSGNHILFKNRISKAKSNIKRIALSIWIVESAVSKASCQVSFERPLTQQQVQKLALEFSRKPSRSSQQRPFSSSHRPSLSFLPVFHLKGPQIPGPDAFWWDAAGIWGRSEKEDLTSWLGQCQCGAWDGPELSQSFKRYSCLFSINVENFTFPVGSGSQTPF